MQEEVNQKTVALSIRTTKLTGKVLAAALGKVARALQKHHRKALTQQGRQSVKKLMNHYGGKSAMPYVGAPKDFDRIAKEFHVDYAFHKVSPGHYLLFFKANQADAITAAFQKYSAKVLNPGTDFGTKLMGMLDTFPKAFETYWPGLGSIDLLVGLAGAAGVYLLIQSKIRQAKKFRRDAEYGTARWGTKEDIKPFVDPKFQNNVILTGTEFLTMNTRPKIPANARNLNACVIGSSGSGKTRLWLTPQLLQAHSSYVVVDPKGGTLDQCGRFLQREKYKVRVLNSIDFSKSMHYNPLAYIKTESDVLKFVTALIANTKGDGKEGDEFWTKAETLLYCALVAYIVFEGPEEERNMNTLVEMINSMEVREDDETFKNAVDYMFDGLERRSPQHFAVRQYKKYKLASGKTAKSILISCGARLAPFDIPQLREIMSYDELWDEAANTGQVPGLEKIVAVIRSREISLTLFYQAISVQSEVGKGTLFTLSFLTDL